MNFNVMNQLAPPLGSHWARILLLCLFFIGSAQAAIPVDRFMDGYNLASQTRVLKHPPADIEKNILSGAYDALFQATGQTNFGFSKEAIWFLIPVENRAQSPRTWVLCFPYALLDRVDLFWIDEHGEKHVESSGDGIASFLRNSHDRDVSFQLTEPAESRRTYYLRVLSQSSLQLNHYAYTPSAYEQEVLTESFVYAIFFGGFIAMGLYNLSLAFSTRSPHYFFYSVLVMLSVIREAYLSGLAYQLLWPDSPIFNEYAGIYSMSCSIILSNIFITESIELKSKGPIAHRILMLAAGICVFYMIAYPFVGYRAVIRPLSFQVIVNSLVILYICVTQLRNGFRAARFLMIAWIFALGGWMLTAVAAYGIVSFSMITKYANPMGQFLEIIFLSFALSDRINTLRIEKNKAIIALNKGLENQVKEKTQDIQSILDSIPLGILKIDGAGTLKKGYSRFMEQLIPAQPIEGSSFKDLILKPSNLSSDESQVTMTIIASSVHESELQWSINSGLLPQSIQLGPRSFEMQWSPIFSSETQEIKEILLVLKDVTELRSQEIENERKRKENDLILSIIKTRHADFSRFMKNAEAHVTTLQRIFRRSPEAWLAEDINEAWRVLHTLKGVSRSLGFRSISAMIHDAESLLLNYETSDPDILRQSLDKLHQELQEYKRIDQDVLMRAAMPTPEVSAADLAYEVSQVESQIASGLTGVDAWMHHIHRLKALYRDNLTHIAQVQLANFRKIAEGLGKPLPDLNIEDDNYFFDDKAKDIIDAILVHLFRNSLDHGIERPEERSGRKAAGTIALSLQVQPDRIQLRYRDDGRGLCLTRIQAKARQLGFLRRDQDASPAEIAALIFHPGFSTADKVTEISGRGVGMDAVRHIVEAAGGSISIALDEPRVQADLIHARFQLDIHLPRT